MLPLWLIGVERKRFPLVVATLVLLCAAAYRWEIMVGIFHAMNRFGYVAKLIPHQPYRLITHMFIHGNFEHIFFNMWFLIVFGYMVENVYGHRITLLGYFLTGIMAVLLYTLVGHYANFPVNDVNLVGASGAISGLLGMCMPFADEIAALLLIVAFPVVTPAYAAIFCWFLIQLYLAFVAPVSGIAYAAHVAGFVSGWALGYVIDGIKKPVPLLTRVPEKHTENKEYVENSLNAVEESRQNEEYDEEYYDFSDFLEFCSICFNGHIPSLDWNRFTDNSGWVELVVTVKDARNETTYLRFRFRRKELEKYLRENVASHHSHPFPEAGNVTVVYKREL